MAAAVRALIVEAHPFSRLAKLRAEDGQSLVLTRHAAGFERVSMREGSWLICEVDPERHSVVAVQHCQHPPEGGWSGEVQFVPSAKAQIEKALSRFPSLHRPPPPAEEPWIDLSCWQVFELPSGARHACGRNDASGEGRVSSMLSELQPQTALLRSGRGRVYKLVGAPGVNPDGEYVWLAWLSMYGIALSDVTSVTNVVWATIQKSS